MVRKKSHKPLVLEFLPTTLGCWQVHHDNRHLFKLSWTGWEIDTAYSLSDFACQIQNAINHYTETGQLDHLTVPIQLHTTPFLSRVLEQLNKIPCGQTKSYGDLATILKSSPRAVGQACRTNPIQLFIPCHRVVSKSGLGGYMGKQKNTDLKAHLLNLEASLGNVPKATTGCKSNNVRYLA